jgi:hypothetical protein
MGKEQAFTKYLKLGEKMTLMTLSVAKSSVIFAAKGVLRFIFLCVLCNMTRFPLAFSALLKPKMKI